MTGKLNYVLVTSLLEDSLAVIGQPNYVFSSRRTHMTVKLNYLVCSGSLSSRRISLSDCLTELCFFL